MLLSISALVTVTDKYTGRSVTREVIAISKSGAKVTISRPDLFSGKETFNRNSEGVYSNYSSNGSDSFKFKI